MCGIVVEESQEIFVCFGNDLIFQLARIIS
jgi:hypothetical protein